MKLSQEKIRQWMRKKTSRPMKFSELAECFAVSDTQRREFRNLVKTMVNTVFWELGNFLGNFLEIF